MYTVQRSTATTALSLKELPSFSLCPLFLYSVVSRGPVASPRVFRSALRLTGRRSPRLLWCFVSFALSSLHSSSRVADLFCFTSMARCGYFCSPVFRCFVATFFVQRISFLLDFLQFSLLRHFGDLLIVYFAFTFLSLILYFSFFLLIFIENRIITNLLVLVL